MLVFGGNITGFNMVNYFARNVDNILIGRVWGAGPLGFYSRAYNLLMLPISQINMPIGSVAVPALSRLQGDLQKYKAYYLKMISLISLVSTPLVGFLIVCSNDVIQLVLGSQWGPSSRIFSVLGFSALIQPLYFTQGWLHVSSGRSDRYLRWGVVSSAFIVVSFIAGLPYGAFGVAVAYTVATWALVAPGMWYAGGSAGIAVRDILGAVYKNFLAGLGSIAVSMVFLDRILLLHQTWANLLAGLLSISFIYNLLLLVFYRDLTPWRQVIDVAQTLVRPVGRTARETG